ncbi:MAG: DMT family transporter [Alphaproteobacteria bacterium]
MTEHSRIARGTFWMLASIATFSIMDTIAKYLSADYPTAVIMWIRHLSQGIFVVGLLARHGGFSSLRSARPALQIGRASCNILSTFLFIYALAFVGLADAIAISSVGPLMLTALSVPLLGEKVGIRRWSAVFVGFLGALIIVRPGLGTMHWAAMLFLVAAFLNALFQIGTRKVSAADSVATTLFYTTATGLVMTTLAVPFFWVDVPGWVWALLIGQGLLAGAAHLFQNRAFALAPASAIAPLTYASLVAATALGFAVFGNLPDRWTIIGAFIVVGSGFYVIYRESVRKHESAI